VILTYVDESGINFQRNGNTFVDGPFIVWCGLLISEEKYFALERMFYDLVKKKLKVKNWETTELHGTDIWLRNGQFSNLSEKAVREYFGELVQLIGKLDIKIVVGVKKKSKGLTSTNSKNLEIKKAIYAFLHGLEHKISELNETTIVIADEGSTLLEELYFDRTKWRYNPGAKKSKIVKSKYFFESLSCFLLDQVHHVKSSKSLFIQVADNLTYVIRKVYEHAYYANNPAIGINADPLMVPVTPEDFCWLSRNIISATFSDKEKDVFFTKMGDISIANTNYIGGAISSFH